MTALLVENMAPLMFAALIVVMLLGYPVAFALGAVGIGFGLLGIELGLLQATLFQALPERIWGVMSNDTLLAIPFFTFMGLILERSGMAEDLLETIGQLFGPVRGGLAYAVIFVGALLAATTGVVAASVISMGLISLPIMLRYGYDRRLASGVIAASGTLAQIIPPSLVLIIMADQLGKSVGDMYAGAFIPGFVLTGLYASYIVGVCVFKPAWAPALPVEARTLNEPNGDTGTRSLLVLFVISVAVAVAFAKWYYPPDAPLDEIIVVATSVGTAFAFFSALIGKLLKVKLLSQLAERVVFVLIPVLALIFLVLGTIFLGVATPTEGGAMGATGALIMALARNRLTWKLLKQGMDTTAKLTAFVVFILVGARVFSLTFYGVNGHVWVEHLLSSLPGGQLGFLIVVNILIFFLAFFLDFFELCVHHRAAGGPGGGKAGHRPHLVRRAAGRQHADVVHASAVRVRAVLPAQRRAGQGLSGQDHRQAHRQDHDGPDLLGRGAVRDHPDHHGGAGHRVSADGDGVQGGRGDHRSEQVRNQNSRRGEPCGQFL